ncbi:MAG: ATP-dependent helicase [Thermomicrobiales bacterium]|nr:ATP-dependent helicase [Thermomicrobiales bacterium]
MTENRSLNQQQQAAVRHPGGPMRIIAGAGTGKTQTLMHRFLYLVESGIRKDRILCLTFSRKATQELRRRLLHQLDHGHGSLHVHTFHAFCKVLIDEWNVADRRQPLRLLTGSELTQFVLTTIHAIPDDELRAHQGAFGREKLAGNLLTFGSQTRDLLMSPDDVDAYALHAEPAPGRLHDLALAHRRVIDAMAAAQVYDFAALGVEVVRRLQTDADLLDRARKRFDHLLIDEFQDTNVAQFELIRLLSHEACPVSVVGDANQAIYAFRGGGSRYLDGFDTFFPGARTYALDTNYRSGQAILDPANALIRHNPGADHLELTAADPARAGVVTVVQTANPALEAAHIARTILELTHRRENPVLYGEIAILLRSTDRNSAPIERALAANGIPFQARDEGQGNAESIRDVLAALRLVCGPAQWRDAARLVGKRNRDTAQMLRAIEAAVPDPDERDALLDRAVSLSGFPSRQQTALREIRQLSGMAKQFGEREVPVALYHAMLLADVLGETTDAITTSTMNAFIAQANAVADAGESLTDLARQLTAGYASVPWGPPVQSDGVAILTVHAAKGLEWPVVFLPAMIDGEFPLPMKLDADFDAETLGDWSSRGNRMPTEQERRARFLCEERRLAYVAMTRARAELHISFPARTREGAPASMSHFITEAKLSDRLALSSQMSDDRPPVSTTDLARQLRTRRNAAMTTDIGDESMPARLAGLLLEQAAANRGWAGAKPLLPRQLPMPFSPETPIPLSYSQLRIYEGCPRQYFYARTLDLAEGEESANITFGSVIHAALNSLNLSWQQSGQLPSDNQIEAAIEAHWPERGFQFAAQTRQLRVRATAILQRYFAWEGRQIPPRRPVLVESSFDTGYGRHQIAGRIDVVLIDDNGAVEIIDFKTSKWTSSSVRKPAESLQLFVYDHAHRLENPEALPTVAFYALRHDDDRGFTNIGDWDPRQIKAHQHSEDSRQMLTARLDTLLTRLEANDFAPRAAHDTCSRCSYRWLCPEGTLV